MDNITSMIQRTAIQRAAIRQDSQSYRYDALSGAGSLAQSQRFVGNQLTGNQFVGSSVLSAIARPFSGGQRGAQAMGSADSTNQIRSEEHRQTVLLIT